MSCSGSMTVIDAEHDTRQGKVGLPTRLVCRFVGKRLKWEYAVLVTCPSCGQSRWVLRGTLGGMLSFRCITCNASRAGAGRHFSRGVMMTHGYAHVMLDPDDPFYPMARRSGYVPLHRLIMAGHLGRLLTPGEVVHHKDGNRLNNSIANLELLSIGEHVSAVHKELAGLRARIKELEQENTRLKEMLHAK